MNDDAQREADEKVIAWIRYTLSGMPVNDHTSSSLFSTANVALLLRLLDESRSAPRAEITEEEVGAAFRALTDAVGEGKHRYEAMRIALSAACAYRDAEIARMWREIEGEPRR